MVAIRRIYMNGRDMLLTALKKPDSVNQMPNVVWLMRLAFSVTRAFVLKSISLYAAIHLVIALSPVWYGKRAGLPSGH
ncbi:MAG: hypothetical protein A3G25_02705 [Betaproteobacteria bacterium RIFCSPLOWO2_12_FULL_63_13]|nr:MAG: hypothetical protein A3G25_02705 [Betaproteobacteria bacterium RIFCSPLOWO2_12_FULL_63_13]